VAYHDPLIAGAPGHGEGHNSGQAANITAALSVKKIMERNHLSGTLKIWPGVAEELDGAKPYFVRAGLFKDVDVCLFSHVASTMKTSWGAPRGSGSIDVIYNFQGERRGRTDGCRLELPARTPAAWDHIPDGALKRYIGQQPLNHPAPDITRFVGADRRLLYLNGAARDIVDWRRSRDLPGRPLLPGILARYYKAQSARLNRLIDMVLVWKRARAGSTMMT
jgi:hypothetical protein